MNAPADKYCPYYCEENVWHQCASRTDPGAKVVFISNPPRSVALWFQRAAPGGKGPVIWDYHVIWMGRGATGSEVVDLDTTLGPRVHARDYLDRTFAGTHVLPPAHAPLFRVIPAELYQRTFSSKREHMRDASGNYSAPPPSWPTIEQGDSNLDRFVDMQAEFVGQVLDLAQMRAAADE